MDRPVDRGELGRVQFRLATRDDEPAIQRLLRDHPMPGWVSLTMERSPSYFDAAAVLGEEHCVIVAVDEAGEIVCTGEVTYRERFINGMPMRVGYLGALRLSHRAQSAGRVLRGGYSFFRTLLDGLPPCVHFTSIAADNHRARRFLEAGLSGMPIYQPIDAYVTYCLNTRGARPIDATPSIDPTELQRLLYDHGTRRQLAVVNAASSHGPTPEDFVGIHVHGRLVAAAALWDQRAFRQSVVRGYARPISIARPLLNLLPGTMRLPAVGEVLPMAFASHLAVAPDAPATATQQLIAALLRRARERRIEMVCFGFADGDPLGAMMQGRRCLTYRSQLYLVEWPGRPSGVTLDNRPAGPDVALL